MLIVPSPYSGISFVALVAALTIAQTDLAHAQANCVNIDDVFYCSGPASSTLAINASDPVIVLEDGLEIDTRTVSGGAGGDALAVTAAGSVDLSYGSVNDDIFLAGEGRGLFVESNSSNGQPSGGVISARGTFTGSYGIEANVYGGSGDFDFTLDGGSVEASDTGISVARSSDQYGSLRLAVASGSKVSGESFGIRTLSSAALGAQTNIEIGGLVKSNQLGMFLTSRGDLTLRTLAGSRVAAPSGILARVTGWGTTTIDLAGELVAPGLFGIDLAARSTASHISISTQKDSKTSGQIKVLNNGRGNVDFIHAGTLVAPNLSDSGVTVRQQTMAPETVVQVVTEAGSQLGGPSRGIDILNVSNNSDTYVYSEGTVRGLLVAGIDVETSGPARDVYISAENPTSSISGGGYGIQVSNQGTGLSQLVLANQVLGTSAASFGVSIRNRETAGDVRFWLQDTGAISGDLIGLSAGAENSAINMSVDGTVTGRSGIGVDLVTLSSGGQILLDLGPSARVNAYQTAIRVGAGNASGVKIIVDGNVSSQTNAAVIASSTGGLTTATIGRSATITSRQGDGIQFAGQADLTLAGKISALNGAAVRFDQGLHDDKLELRNGWAVDGFIDAGGGEDTLRVGDGAVLKAGDFGPASTFRSFENLALAHQSMLFVNVNTPVLTASGDVSLGGTLLVQYPGQATQVNGQNYDIISSGGMLSGTFDEVVMANGSAFIVPTLLYLNNSATVTLNLVSFETVAQTPTQAATARALDSFEKSGDTAVVINALAGLDSGAARRALDDVNGQVEANVQDVVDQTFSMLFQGHRPNPMRGIRSVSVMPLGYVATSSNALQHAPSIIATGVSETSPVNQGFWLQGTSAQGVIGANNQQTSWASSALNLGYEAEASFADGDAWAGVSVGFGGGGVNSASGTSSAKLQTFSGGLYGGWHSGPWTVSGTLAYAATNVESRRTLVFGTIDRTAGSQYWLHQIGASGEASYAFALTDTTEVGPLVRMGTRLGGHAGFAEFGAGSLNLESAGTSELSMSVGTGVRLTHEIPTAAGLATLGADILWQRDQPLASAGSVKLAGSAAQLLRPDDNGSNRMDLALRASLQTHMQLELGAGYQTSVSDGRFAHAGMLTLKGKL